MIKPLRAANLDMVLFDKVVPNPHIALVDEGAELYLSQKWPTMAALFWIMNGPIRSRLRSAFRRRFVCPIDPELTLELLALLTAGTGMDALAHATSCYTCAYAQPLPVAMEYVGQYLRVAYTQGRNVEARYKMSMAAMLGALAYGTESAGAATP